MHTPDGIEQDLIELFHVFALHRAAAFFPSPSGIIENGLIAPTPPQQEEPIRTGTLYKRSDRDSRYIIRSTPSFPFLTLPKPMQHESTPVYCHHAALKGCGGRNRYAYPQSPDSQNDQKAFPSSHTVGAGGNRMAVSIGRVEREGQQQSRRRDRVE